MIDKISLVWYSFDREREGNTMGVASFVLGIVSMLIYFIDPLSALGLSAAGITLGALSRKSSKENNQKSGLAITGFVLSIVAAAISALKMILAFALATVAAKFFGFFY